MPNAQLGPLTSVGGSLPQNILFGQLKLRQHLGQQAGAQLLLLSLMVANLLP